MKTKLIFATLLLTLNFPRVSFASSFEGVIQEVQFSPGQSPARVSIRVAPHGAPSTCSALYFAYENADFGIGRIWTAAILAAYANSKTVQLVGTGNCDTYGIEVLYAVSVK